MIGFDLDQEFPQHHSFTASTVEFDQEFAVLVGLMHTMRLPIVQEPTIEEESPLDAKKMVRAHHEQTKALRKKIDHQKYRPAQSKKYRIQQPSR